MVLGAWVPDYQVRFFLFIQKCWIYEVLMSATAFFFSLIKVLLRRGACSQYPKKNSESKQHAGRLGCHRVKLIAGPGAGRIQSFFQILIHVAVVRTPLVCVTTRRLRPVRARLPACLACLRASPKATAKKEHHSSTPARHEASLHRSSPCCVPARSVGRSD